MNKEIYMYLVSYINKIYDKKNMYKPLKNLDRLVKDKTISYGLYDDILSDIDKLVDNLVKELSKCKYLEIRITQPMQQTIIHKYPTPKRGADAIGFTYEEPEELEEDLD